jgi:hypothetical protein
MFDCAWLKWPAPVSPESFYTHPMQYLERAANCPHFKPGRKPDLVLNEITD